MFHYIYPAVFLYSEDEYHALIPDLNLQCAGVSLEEAFILAKDFLRAYFEYAVKFDLDTQLPSHYTDISEKYKSDKNTIVMLVDAIVKKPEN